MRIPLSLIIAATTAGIAIFYIMRANRKIIRREIARHHLACSTRKMSPR